MFWSIFNGPFPVMEGWDARNTPWFWSLLYAYHQVCRGVLEDWTLRDLEGNPPPRDMWFDKEALDTWRKDREEERKRQSE